MSPSVLTVVYYAKDASTVEPIFEKLVESPSGFTLGNQSCLDSDGVLADGNGGELNYLHICRPIEIRGHKVVIRVLSCSKETQHFSPDAFVKNIVASLAGNASSTKVGITYLSMPSNDKTNELESQSYSLPNNQTSVETGDLESLKTRAGKIDIVSSPAQDSFACAVDIFDPEWLE